MASSRRKLIVVSNRGPVSYARDGEGSRVARRGGGGLVTALRGLVSHHDVTWIASAMSDEDRAFAAETEGAAVEETARDGSVYRLRFVVHEPIAYDWFYNVVANPTLWFLQHSMWDLTQSPDVDLGLHHAWFNGYLPVNQGFADAVTAELERDHDQAVFFHDYHLYLAPRMVRDRVPDALLGHFVHVPWPQSDYWTVLPAHLREAVHDGLLANDVVGFHTDRWRRNFIRSCEDIARAEVDWGGHVVSCGGWRTLVTARPISVDPSEFDELKESDRVLEEERALVATRPEYLVVRVDRTDPSKNVVRGFRAFGLFLDYHPELHGRVQLLALLDPSRQDIPEYSEYLAAIQREARAVNDRFQSEGWVPIRLEIADNFPQAVAAYKQYDVLLVNAVFDGLNLVAKEAPLVNTRDGVLVLSENAGAHEEIGQWALTINPFDIYGQAQAIYEAIRLAPDERRSRIEAIREHVRANPVEGWIDAQLADLRERGDYDTRLMAAISSRELYVVSPATLEPVGSVRVTEPGEVQEAVASARLAQERWAGSSFAERAALLGRVAVAVLDHFDEIAATISAETGKPPVESAVTDLLSGLDALVWAGKNAARILRDDPVKGSPFLRHKRGRVVYEPLGVVAGLTPWNFPLGIPLGLAGSAVAAGNALVLKPSELTPLSGRWVERVFAEAGAPAGLVRVVQGEADVGAALVGAHGIAKVVFTGSPAVGRLVAQAAAERLVPVTLELGGKDPMLVFADADFDRAVAGALWASFANCGQVCAGVERIYVERSIHEPFLEELSRRAGALRLGEDVGPLISERQLERVERIVAAAAGEVRTGGRRAARQGWFYEPTVIAGEAGDDEVFGPVASVFSFDNEADAIRRANDSPYALGASVWTRDRQRAARVSAALRAGSVWTNDHAYSYGIGGAPWGGRGRSGYGRTHGRHGLYELSHIKYADDDSGRVPVPWWYPYDDSLVGAFELVGELLYGDGVARKAAAAWRHRRELFSIGKRYLR